jgi:hypothetical protein
LLTRPVTGAAAAVAAALLLSACTVGGGASGPTDAGFGTSPTDGGGASAGGGPAPYLPVPDGVVLTDPGSELGLGEKATVAWRIRQGRGQGQVGALDVKVRKLVRADIGDLKDWQLDADGRTSALYYVTVTVANVGDVDLSDRRIPLYVLDGAGALVESSTFKTDFDPCPSPAMPEGFVTGEKTTVCQAYLVPKRGDLRAVAFWPTDDFNAITWVGKVTEPKQPKQSKKQPTAGE